MTGTLLRAQDSAKSFAETEVFFCPEESQFYSHCLERLVFSTCADCDDIVEFGCGDGSPVINSLLRTQFDSTVYGYDLNAAACEVAQARIKQYSLNHKYVIRNQSFFSSDNPSAQYLIANPPYLPAIDNDICMPLLHGGIDGAAITNRLLTLDYPNVMVLISSYSNPLGTIFHALEHGYKVIDFMLTPLKFGYYSSEAKVKQQIIELRRKRQAFFSGNVYFLAGVLFKKTTADVDISPALIQAITAL
ncbi:methyltransferase [Leptolyngbya sp. FACHB-36]|uniref:methyltransferase n=1 Tax=Leptolyngbya sp. FACHB-36 TaxID=2692808 RepID=UPI00168060E7|nr:methyltransferase [Leptolyngbya sp. FACHB-36]MBD2019722.1 methyltransferase [Leptolyngbya sp. FACHB-36]